MMRNHFSKQHSKFTHLFACQRETKCHYTAKDFYLITQHQCKTAEGQDKKKYCDLCGKSLWQERLKKHHCVISNEVLKCIFCVEEFKYDKALRDHCFNNHSNNKMYKCPEKGCHITSNRLGIISKHLKGCKQMFVCDMCCKRFRSKIEMLYHLTSDHLGISMCKRSLKKILACKIPDTKDPVNQNVCKICNITCSSLSYLTRHYNMVHTSQGHLNCRFCSAHFKTQTNLRRHCYREHGRTDVFKCQKEGCSYTAVKFPYIGIHIREKHDLETNFTCDRCGASYLKKSSLKIHEDSCYNEKRFLCDLCGKGFNLFVSMKNHRKTQHFGERSFKCKVCSKTFGSHQNLGRHMRIHNNSFPYLCTTCNKKFRHSNSLKYHIDTCHQTK